MGPGSQRLEADLQLLFYEQGLVRCCELQPVLPCVLYADLSTEGLDFISLTKSDMDRAQTPASRLHNLPAAKCG